MKAATPRFVVKPTTDGKFAVLDTKRIVFVRVYQTEAQAQADADKRNKKS